MLTTRTHSESIAYLGEIALIEQIRAWLGPVTPSAPQGIGDDCAVLTPPLGANQIITTDSVSYGQHFDDSVPPKDAGAKLIKRNLSDIAAMGGTPGPAVLALLCGSDISTRWLKQFFDGIRESCEHYKVKLVGGDISSLSNGNFSAVLTLTGHTHHPKLRSTAKVGDHIYVTGTLGGSILGKHYQFEPRLAEGQWLSQNMHCSAQMDLTDGIAKDLKSLLPKETHAALDLDQIPIAAAAHTLSKSSGRSALEHACCDGEDYELLFTADAQVDRERFETDWKTAFPQTELQHIGRIRPSAAVGQLINAQTNSALPWAHGFEHLKPQ